MTLRARALAATSLALAALAIGGAAAPAATPASGSVSIYEPLLAWDGEAAGGAVNLAHFLYGKQLIDDCDPKWCDRFTLTVEQPDQKLEIRVEDDGSGYTEVQIKDAAGNEVFWSDGDNDEPTTYTRLRAPAGTYTVEVLTDSFGTIDDPSYSATAKLNNGVAVPRPESAEG